MPLPSVLSSRARLTTLAALSMCLCLSAPQALAQDIRTPDGGVYQGELQEGRLHGQGQLAWPNGTRYEGGFADGLMHGEGVLDSPNWRYEGGFVKGQMNGQGHMMFSDGSSYEGFFRDGKFNGRGQYSLPNGDVYKGMFKDGQFHGDGRLDRADGRIYMGRFERGQPAGKVRYINGQRRYEGTLKDWQPHGQGRLLDADENVFEGHFEQGQLHGQGKLSTRAGGSYEGGFQQGRFHGQGVLRSPGGDEYRGGFANGVFEGEGVLRYAKPRPDGRNEERGTWRQGRLFDPAQEAVQQRNVETVLYNQPALLEAALQSVAPHDPERIDLFWLGVAGDGRQEVFRREVDWVRAQFERDFGAQGRAISLVNSRSSVEQQPLATHTSLKRSLATLAERMDLEQDILFVFLTSHGSEDHELTLQLDGVDLPDLSATQLASMLRETGVRWKMVVVSACYSGGFLTPLKDDHTLVITASRPDRTSFGCSDDNQFTYFGRAYFQQSLTPQLGFAEAFAQARDKVAALEKEMFSEAGKGSGLEHSEPMIHAPAPILQHLQRWQAQRLAQQSE